MEYRYDLHIHSCLSPCAEDDMTPCNLVQMALLCGREIIALTDHNSCQNCRAAMKAGQRAGLVVVPGMELCTAEEAHVVCLFDTADAAEAFSAWVAERLPRLSNRPDIFGRQWKMDADDRVTGEETLLLSGASDIALTELPGLMQRFGGACFPAHIDRPSYSVVASLGALPPECGFRTVELAAPCCPPEFARSHRLWEYGVLRNSDAHCLETLAGEPEALSLPSPTPAAVVRAVRQGAGRRVKGETL